MVAKFGNISIFDVNVEPLLKNIKKYQPDVVGLSALTPFYKKTIHLARLIKKALPGTITIIGGHHINHDQALSDLKRMVDEQA